MFLSAGQWLNEIMSKDGWKKRMDFLGMAPFVTIQNKRPRPGREHNAV